MKFLKVRNDLWMRITRHCNVSLAGCFAAAFWMLIFFTIRPACAWELFVAPRDNNFGNVMVDSSSGPQVFELCNVGTRDLRITRLSFGFTLQASIEIGEELVLGLVSDIYLNSLQVPVFALDLSRRYFWPPSLANRVGQISAPSVEQD